MLGKRGYFFLVDSMVALGVLTVGIVLLLSQHESAPSTGQPQVVAVDVIAVLSSNKVKNINDDYAGANSELTRNGNITDIDKTLLEQAAEFYYRSEEKSCDFCLGLAENFLERILTDLTPREYQYQIIIEGTLVYDHSTTAIDESRFVIPSRKIVHGLYNQSELYGPYVVEVLSWG